MESYTVDEVTGRLEVNITSSTPFPGPLEVVLTMTTSDGTAEGIIMATYTTHLNNEKTSIIQLLDLID